MSESTAKVIFDFMPDIPGGLQIISGEIVTVLEEFDDGGWCSVRNESGVTGLVPFNYLEILSSTVTSPTSQSVNDDGDSFDSDSELDTPKVECKNVVRHADSTSILAPENSKSGIIRMPRWFMKYGGEEFLLGLETAPKIPEITIQKVLENLTEIYIWKPSEKPRTVEIISHGIDTKYSGIKTFVIYNIQSTYSHQQISRRYNQFDWLFDQLNDKFRSFVIPLLPSKQMGGNFKEDFIKSRQRLLQKWLNHIIEHPVLGQSHAVTVFLSASDKESWKSGKRTVGKDKLKFGRLFSVIDAPIENVSWNSYTKSTESVILFILTYEKSLRTLQEDYSRFHKRQMENVFKMYQGMGNSFIKLSEAMSLNPNNYKKDIELLHGIQMIGTTYQGIGSLFRDQAKVNDELMEENLNEINSITKRIIPLTELMSCIISTVDASNKKDSDSQANQYSKEFVNRNIQVVARSVEAEMNWLQNRRENQIRQTLIQHLQNEIDMHTKMIYNLNEVLQKL